MVCSDRKLASVPLPVYHKEVEIEDKTQGGWNKMNHLYRAKTGDEFHGDCGKIV